MAIDLKEFYESFFQEGDYFRRLWRRMDGRRFFSRSLVSYLVDAGELETADRVPFAPTKGGIRVDGYGGDPVSCDGVLNLIVADFKQVAEMESLSATEMDAAFKRLANFLKKSLDVRFREDLEESNPAFGLADLISKRWSGITKVRMFLISNRMLSSRVDGKPSGEIDGVPITYSVWDITRLYRFAGSSSEREEIVIDLESGIRMRVANAPCSLEGGWL